MILLVYVVIAAIEIHHLRKFQLSRFMRYSLVTDGQIDTVQPSLSKRGPFKPLGWESQKFVTYSVIC